jgi:hypothetical protein
LEFTYEEYEWGGIVIQSKINCIRETILALGHMVMFRDQHAGQNHNVKLGIEFFERVEQFEYMGTTVTYQNYIHEKLGAY